MPITSGVNLFRLDSTTRSALRRANLSASLVGVRWDSHDQIFVWEILVDASADSGERA